MTAQIDDIFRFKGREYAVTGISEGDLFVPSLFHLQPVVPCTACYRGYQAVYGLSESRLVLEELHILLVIDEKTYERQEGPLINGMKPFESRGESDWFNNHYEGLNYPLKYTGGVLLADGFIRKLYVHMGFHPAWKYQAVIELIFDAGILKKESDRSRQMAELRAKVIEEQAKKDHSQMETMEEIARFVDSSFDRRYRL